MGDVSNSGLIGREMRAAVLSGVSEVTRSERHQCNLGGPPLDWKTASVSETVGDTANKETKW